MDGNNISDPVQENAYDHDGYYGDATRLFTMTIWIVNVRTSLIRVLQFSMDVMNILCMVKLLLIMECLKFTIQQHRLNLTLNDFRRKILKIGMYHPINIFLSYMIIIILRKSHQIFQIRQMLQH